MKAIMVMFDSLNRNMLPPYGCDWTVMPNFQRLAERSVTFDRCFVGSMPCMPARRELHTGRYNFLHRSWGPLEPFDDSMPGILKGQGIYTHLISDHGHYWEDGGCTYHTRYNSWEITRGQEGDPWKGEVKDPQCPPYIGGNANKVRQDWINRKYLKDVDSQPQAKTFKLGLDFIKTNYEQDNWFLQIETFDPHEPFFTQQKYKDYYKHNYDGPHFDWPQYKRVEETREQVEHCRYEYAALLTMCDEHLGKVLDMMDQFHMWDDTMLIVNTDHGFLLGEHDWWAKCTPPFYNEVANTPLFIWDPRSRKKDIHCDCLVQTIDIAPTLLDYFNVEIPKDMQGKSLKDAIAFNTPVREAGLFGMHGGNINCTDGRYVYMRGPTSLENSPLYNYTLMPTHMKCMFSMKELKGMELTEPFDFTKECKLMKIDCNPGKGTYHHGSLLFDIEQDPKQMNPIEDTDIEKKMVSHMIKLMKENDAPIEQYQRLGLIIGDELYDVNLSSEPYELEAVLNFVNSSVGI